MSPFATPSPSPPSSPCSAPIDSSPAASPRIAPISLDSPPSPVHPFSASNHSDRLPPQYEKKLVTPPATPPQQSAFFRSAAPARKFTRSYGDDDYLHDVVASRTDARSVRTTIEDRERELWDATIARAIDSADGKIDLSEYGLTYIPTYISDLSSLVILSNHHSSNKNSGRTFSRIATTATDPRHAAHRVRSLGGSQSTNALVFSSGMREEEIHLYLGNNSIRLLPNELFSLDALVVLSLRGNLITELPPQINQLTNLRELNLSFNKLTYLPSELLQLRLTSLTVEPNPFIVPPSHYSNGIDAPISDTQHICARVPPLTELALRAILTPAPSGPFTIAGIAAAKGRGKRALTCFEAYYELPLPADWGLSPPIEQILSACVPNCIAASPRGSPVVHRPAFSASTTGATHCISTCPGPRHRVVAPGTAYRRPVFVKHAEERYTWEAEVAGVRISSGSAGGRVPVRWRGCGWGCLDYLGSGIETEGDSMDVDVDYEKSKIGTIDEGEMEVQFTSQGFEFDDDD